MDLEGITDPGLRHAFRALLNLVEQLATENRTLRDENQQLRDEINRLKGEQGKPTFTPTRRTEPAPDYSSERERRQPGTWQKRPKLDRLTITRTERLTVDPTTLPADAAYKGIKSVVVQDVVVHVEVIRFERDEWYSPSQHRTYRAVLPAGYDGEFGPGLKALVLGLHFGANVTEAKLLDLLRSFGVEVSRGWLAMWLSEDRADFAHEAQAVERAGLASSPWQHSDTTATRVDGEARHCHIIGNPLFTAYHTLPKKDRLAVLSLLRGGGPLTYRWDAEADAYLDWVGLSATARRRLSHVPHDHDLDEATLTDLLDAQQRWLGPQQRTRVREALALAAYQAQTDWPIVRALVCDDAGQYRAVTDELGLCWIHEGRHYTKLVAHVPQHQRLLAEVQRQFWAYYRELLAYRERPTPEERIRLEQGFNTLFGTVTGFRLLDDRLALTREKQAGLLLVLRHPELPLHNNPAELAARRRVRKRDASFGPRSEAGSRAWDTFMTLGATVQQLGISFSRYLQDRLTQAGQIPPLADLITERARTLNLGSSWAAP